MNNRITQFSACRKYRYVLWRGWDTSDCEYLMVIGVNPSIANEADDDPTVTACLRVAKELGFGALCMVNLFAWVDTYPGQMRKAAAPVGPENDRWLLECARDAGLILAAWGRHGTHLDRDEDLMRLLQEYDVHHLKLNNDFTPHHPLYLKKGIKPTIYAGRTVLAAAET